jgi:ribosomal protein L32
MQIKKGVKIMGYSYYGSSFGNFVSNSTLYSIVAVVSVILAVIGGIVLYFTFLSKKNENKFKGFAGGLYNFLNFKSMFAEVLLKILYLISSIGLTLFSFDILLFTEGGSIGNKLLSFLLYIIVGNVVVRLIYEFLLISLVICRNTTEINRKMGKSEVENTVRTEQTQPFRPAEIGVVFCRNCGNKFSSNETVCPRCGANKQ